MKDQNIEDYLGIQHQRIVYKKFFGIDYSGGLQAGKKIWICEADYLNDSIYIKSIYSIFHEFGLKSRLESNSKIIEIIENNEDAVIGFDFPFSLPNQALQDSNWKNFILNFKDNFSDENDFRSKMRNLFTGKEIKRFCDIQAKTPFSPYNLRIYKQTFFGISEILKPLIILNNSTILPFDTPKEGKNLIMEVCPASLLKIRKDEIKWPQAYKGNKDIHRKKRSEILKIIENYLNIEYSDSTIKSKILEDPEGDALDSLLCVICSLRGLSYPELSIKNEFYSKEGFVYC